MSYNFILLGWPLETVIFVVVIFEKNCGYYQINPNKYLIRPSTNNDTIMKDTQPKYKIYDFFYEGSKNISTKG